MFYKYLECIGYDNDFYEQLVSKKMESPDGKLDVSSRESYGNTGRKWCQIREASEM